MVQSVTELHGVIPLLQGKISHWSTIVYGESQDANVLKSAWELRCNCPLKALHAYPGLPNDDELAQWVPDHQLIAKEADEAVELWRRYTGSF